MSDPRYLHASPRGARAPAILDFNFVGVCLDFGGENTRLYASSDPLDHYPNGVVCDGIHVVFDRFSFSYRDIFELKISHLQVKEKYYLNVVLSGRSFI